MIRVLADGEQRHRLEDADGRLLGWIRRRAVGLRGFASERDAMTAAVDGWRALETALRREYAGWPRFEPALTRLRLVHDGAHKWISDGRTPLARIVRPPADRGSDASYAIEFVLPSYASEGVAIAAAQVVARALQDHPRSWGPAVVGETLGGGAAWRRAGS